MPKLSSNLKLPDSIVTSRLGIVGRTGSGKTNTAIVLAEQFIDAKIPIVIIDPQGDWWGLRAKYPIAILGGDHGDIPLEPTGGELAASFVISERVPVLLDLFSMGEGQMVRFATDFAKRLWISNRQPLHVFLDEADLFAPQKAMGTDKAKCLSAWQNVCRRGRSRGIGLTMITQRPAVINKDLLTQADPFIAHRLTAPQDLNAVDAYLEAHGESRDERRKVTGALAKAEIGEALVISPGELGLSPTWVTVDKRKSFDSGRTPTATKTKSPRNLADVDLGALKTAMADTIERAKENDPKQLQAQVRELRKQLKEQPVDPAVVEKAVNQAVLARDKHWDAHVKVLTKQLDQAHALLGKVRDVATVDPPATLPAPVAPAQYVQTPVAATVTTKTTRVRGGVVPPVTPADMQDWMQPAHRKLLQAMRWLETFGLDQPDRSHVAAIAGVSPRSSSFTNNISRLSANNLLEYPSPGLVRLTDEGRALTVPVETAGTVEELQQAWLNSPALQSAHRRILEALIESYPDEVTREALANRVGVSARSSSFTNNVSRLSSLGLLRYPRPNVVTASEMIFGK